MHSRPLPSAERPLGIGIALAHFHPVRGGAESQLWELAKRWAARGHRIVVLTRPVDGAPRVETVDGVEIRRRVKTVDKGPLFGASFIGSLVIELARAKKGLDLILCGQAPWEAAAAGLASPLLGLPFVVRLAQSGPHGDLAQLQSAKGAPLLGRLLRKGRRFVSLNEESEAELQRLGVPSERVHRLTNGVDVERFAPPENPRDRNPRAALFVGRLTEQKNPLELLAAWRLAAKEGEFLTIAGEGPLAEAIREEMRRGRAQNVALVGSRSDLAGLYRRHGVYVSASKGEGCPNAILEAMASGCCVVASDIAGHRVLIREGENGLLAKGPEPLARQLHRALGDDDLQTRLGAAARRDAVERHSFSAVAEQYLELFRELLQEAR